MTGRKTFFRLFLPQLALLLAAPSILVGQTAGKTPQKALPPSAFKLISIKVTGTTRYTPQDVIAAAGLQVGQIAGEDDFKRASARLGDTGAFGNVMYAFQFSALGTKLDLQVSDAGEWVATRFDNFVWFTDQELLEGIRTRVPLFRDQLPVAGGLTDQVSDALQAMLIEKNVQGRADYLRASHQGSSRIEAIVFSVTGPDIRVRNVAFTGAGPEELSLLQSAAKSMQGQEYLRAILAAQVEKNLLPVYLSHGHLKAAFSDAQPKVVESNNQLTTVDVTFAVTPGKQYKLAGVQWVDNKAFPAEKLQSLIHLKTGEPANAVQLNRDLEDVHRLYGTRGYMAAHLEPQPQMDDEQSTVAYQLKVREGDVYNMGELDIQGLDSHMRDRMRAAWKLQEGKPYDASYPKRFLDESAEAVMPLGPWNVKVHENPDPKDKTVDVTLRFDMKPDVR